MNNTSGVIAKCARQIQMFLLCEPNEVGGRRGLTFLLQAIGLVWPRKELATSNLKWRAANTQPRYGQLS